MRIFTAFLLSALLLPCLGEHAHALPQCQVQWDALDGLLPDAALPPWTLTNTSTTPPSLGATSLTLSTSSNSANQTFGQTGSSLTLPDTLIIEAGVWYVSGSTSATVRAPISIAFGSPGTLSNTLSIGDGELFLWEGADCNSISPKVSLPTADGFHDYRIEVAMGSGQVDVYYDGQHSGLSGALIAMPANCGVGARITFGEGSIFTFGVSEWAYVRHNAGASCGAVSYCTPGTSASGCEPTLSANGTPSASQPAGFDLTAGSVEGGKDGLFFFGTNGRQTNAWGNGTSLQCVVPPVKRGGLLNGTGTGGLCDGSLTQDLNALWTAQPNKNPGPGAVVQAQLWYRDPQNTSNQTTSLTDALEFTVGP